MRVMETSAMKAGQVAIGQSYGANEPVVFVGTGKLTEIEAAGYHGRYLVNKGLRDIVEWLGECPLTINPANNLIAVMRHVSKESVVTQEFQDFWRGGL